MLPLCDFFHKCEEAGGSYVAYILHVVNEFLCYLRLSYVPMIGKNLGAQNNVWPTRCPV